MSTHIGTGVGMHIRGWRAPLIVSAVLGAFVTSCGGQPVYVVVPAPPPAAQHVAEGAPAPEGGLQAPEPVPVAPPVPAALPPAQEGPPAPALVPPAPAAPQALPPVVSRPGGAPPGLRAPDIPDVGSTLDKGEWAKNINIACHKAGYSSGCLGVQYIFYGQGNRRIADPGAYSDCTIKRRTPRGAQYVSLGTTILVEATCANAGTATMDTTGHKSDQNNVVNQTPSSTGGTTKNEHSGGKPPGQPTKGTHHANGNSRVNAQDGSG